MHSPSETRDLFFLQTFGFSIAKEMLVCCFDNDNFSPVLHLCLYFHANNYGELNKMNINRIETIICVEAALSQLSKNC